MYFLQIFVNFSVNIRNFSTRPRPMDSSFIGLLVRKENTFKIGSEKNSADMVKWTGPCRIISYVLNFSTIGQHVVVGL